MPALPRQRTEAEKYLMNLQAHMQEAVKKAQYYDALWNRINDDINDKHDREASGRAASGQLPLTDLMRAKDKDASLPLSDAYAAGQWWRGKASYLAAVIQAEVALRGGVGLL